MTQGLVKFEGSAKAELAKDADEAHELFGLVLDIPIESQADLELASEALAKAKGEYKRLEERKKAVTGPLTAAVNEVRSWFKPAQDYYAKAEASLKKSIADYHARVAQANADAMRLAAEAAASSDIEGVLVATSLIETPDKIKGLSVRETWDFEVLDVSQVPHKYLFVDEAAVKAHIKEHVDERTGEPLPISGIRFFKKAIIASRSK